MPWHGGGRTCVEVEISPRGSTEVLVSRGNGQAGMAAVAQGLKVVFAVRTALIDGNSVVNMLGGNETASSFAQFAKRVPADVQVADLAPAIAVDLVVAGRAAVLIVLASGEGLVQRAEAFGGQFGATGVVAGVWEFGGHGDHPFIAD